MEQEAQVSHLTLGQVLYHSGTAYHGATVGLLKFLILQLSERASIKIQTQKCGLTTLK